MTVFNAQLELGNERMIEAARRQGWINPEPPLPVPVSVEDFEKDKKEDLMSKLIRASSPPAEPGLRDAMERLAKSYCDEGVRYRAAGIEPQIYLEEAASDIRAQIALSATPPQKPPLSDHDFTGSDGGPLPSMPLLHGKALLDYKFPSRLDEDARREAFVSGWLEAVGQSFKDRQDAIDSAHRAFRKYADLSKRGEGRDE